MSSPPSDPPAAFRWLRARPVWFALAVAVVMVLAGLAIFDDLTLVIVDGATSAVLVTWPGARAASGGALMTVSDDCSKSGAI